MSFEEEVLNAYSFLNFGYDRFLGGQMQQAFRRRVSAKTETPQAQRQTLWVSHSRTYYTVAETEQYPAEAGTHTSHRVNMAALDWTVQVIE